VLASAFASRAAIGVEGALLNADIVGRLLTLGGDQLFLYGYTPGQPAAERTCSTGGNMLFSMDNDGNITHRIVNYFGVCLLTQVWLGEPNAFHDLYPVTLDPRRQQAQNSCLAVLLTDRDSQSWSKPHENGCR
jgi:hypothetical protein